MPNILIILFVTTFIMIILRIFNRLDRLQIFHHPDTAYINRGVAHLPYIKRKYLMTKHEYYFYYQFLYPRFSDRYYIIPQVSLLALIDVDRHEIKQKTYRYKINRLRVDYVIFSRPQFSPLLVIEYDDATHMWQKRIERDRFVDESLAAARIPIIHVSSSDYSKNSAELAQRIEQSIQEGSRV